jgi:hypothetical protein
MTPKTIENRCIRTAAAWQCIAVATLAMAAQHAKADEGGVSFWLPGQFGSLVAVPLEPGWSLPLAYYLGRSDASASKTFPRGGRIVAGVDGRADLLFAFPTYTFAEPVLGGQASIGVGVALARIDVSADATLTGPGGNSVTRHIADNTTGGSDLYPQAALRWNDGDHNFMAYAMAGIPTGAYRLGRLSNVGTNHWAIDGGGGYTYFNQKSGRELSVAAGLTYNFKNPDTDYQNGTAFHVDWGASQFLSEQVHVGLVGYWYQQITGDRGAGATLGDFKSRIGAVGPQAGYFFKADGSEWYVNVKAYWEFAAQNRPEGWNLWLSIAIPLGAPKP